MSPDRGRPETLRRWWIGLVVGAVAGAGTLATGVIGGTLGLMAIVLAVWSPPRTAAIGGVLVGVGGAWLALLGRAALACGMDCVAPDLAPWLALAVTLTALGAIVSVRASRRRG